MSAVDDAMVLARLARIAERAVLFSVSLSVPTEREGERLASAIRRDFGEDVEIRVRINPGPPRLVTVELSRE